MPKISSKNSGHLTRTAPPTVLSGFLNSSSGSPDLLPPKIRSDAKEKDRYDDEKPEEQQLQLDQLPEDLRSEHKLCCSWTFWFRFCDPRCWQSGLQQAITVETVQRFWAAFHSLPPVSSLENGTDCSFFKSHVRPMWEDASCRDGGRWMFSLERGSTGQRELLQSAWLELLLLLIGGEVEKCLGGNLICGVVVSVRARGDRLAVWTMEAGSNRVMKLKNIVLESCGLAPNTAVSFEKFHD